jgi:glyoxylase-like metal-dependent hydrolase (beta-lactamase superfamily II)
LPSALGLPVYSAWAQSSISLGQVQIDVLSDGHLTLPGQLMFQGLPEAPLNTVLSKYGVSVDSVEPDCNLTLVRDGERTILFDVGAGPNFMLSAGKLAEAMEAIELDPASVTHVVFTHAHPDHLWGLLDEFDDLLFPEANYMMGKNEWDYWIDPKTVDTIGGARQAFAAGAVRNLKTIEDQIIFIQDGEEILPGIQARETAGHTPGHMAFEIRAGSESVMIVGDSLANHHVAFEKPDWAMGMDQEPQQAAKTRVGLLDQLAGEKHRIIGYHMPFPGIGYAEKKDGTYRFVAA